MVEYSTGNSYVCVFLYMYVHDMHMFFDKHAVTVENKNAATADSVWWKTVVFILSQTALDCTPEQLNGLISRPLPQVCLYLLSLIHCVLREL